LPSGFRYAVIPKQKQKSGEVPPPKEKSRDE
jgi:hypothetical protein